MFRELILELLSQDGYYTLNKKLVKLIGLENSFLLSFFIDKYKFFKEEFFYTKENILNDTRLTEYSLNTSLKFLKDNNLIFIIKKGCPARNYYDINFKRIEELLRTEVKEQSIEKSRKKSEENLTTYYNESTINSATENKTTSDSENSMTSTIENNITSEYEINTTSNFEINTTSDPENNMTSGIENTITYNKNKVSKNKEVKTNKEKILKEDFEEISEEENLENKSYKILENEKTENQYQKQIKILNLSENEILKNPNNSKNEITLKKSKK